VQEELILPPAPSGCQPVKPLALLLDPDHVALQEPPDVE